MARPKKDAAEARSLPFHGRLTPSEALAVKANAAAAGLTVSEFCRRRILGMTVTPPPARADAALIAEVNRIGVNVNQLAHAFNADRTFRSDWEAIRDEVASVLDKVVQRYGS